MRVIASTITKETQDINSEYVMALEEGKDESNLLETSQRPASLMLGVEPRCVEKCWIALSQRLYSHDKVTWHGARRMTT